jgi:hypothetical protein
MSTDVVEPVSVDITASGLMAAVEAVARHRQRPTRDAPLNPKNGLLVHLAPDDDAGPRAIVAATNGYSGALATTAEVDGGGEMYSSPSDPEDAWADCAAPPDAFDSPLLGGVFDADRYPVRDIGRLAEDDPTADITLTVQGQSLRLDGPGGHLLWRRIGGGYYLFDVPEGEPGEGATVSLSTLAPNVGGIIDDLVSALPADHRPADVAWTWRLLKLHESLCGIDGVLRIVHPTGRRGALVTAIQARTPRIGLIMPVDIDRLDDAREGVRSDRAAHD